MVTADDSHSSPFCLDALIRCFRGRRVVRGLRGQRGTRLGKGEGTLDAPEPQFLSSPARCAEEGTRCLLHCCEWWGRRAGGLRNTAQGGAAVGGRTQRAAARVHVSSRSLLQGHGVAGGQAQGSTRTTDVEFTLSRCRVEHAAQVPLLLLQEGAEGAGGNNPKMHQNYRSWTHTLSRLVVERSSLLECLRCCAELSRYYDKREYTQCGPELGDCHAALTHPHPHPHPHTHTHTHTHTIWPVRARRTRSLRWFEAFCSTPLICKIHFAGRVRRFGLSEVHNQSLRVLESPELRPKPLSTGGLELCVPSSPSNTPRDNAIHVARSVVLWHQKTLTRQNKSQIQICRFDVECARFE